MTRIKQIIITSITIILIIGIAFILFFTNKNTEGENTKNESTNETSILDTSDNSENKVEIPPLKLKDEQTLEVQEVDLENENFEQQGEVAYNGSDKIPNIKLGPYKGLTYYSQADKRWAKYIYSAINDKSQTMLQSGCGPTAAAIVVSSIKGEVTPPKMADLFVKYGYRSKNSGTYWSGLKWIADAFNIELKQTSSFDTMLSQLKNNNYIISTCKEGLFTYGGHFIVIIGIDGNTLKIYDPYLYNSKFTTSTRKGKAIVKGNTVYVTISNFKKYANTQSYFCYKNEKDMIKEENNINLAVNNSLSTPTKNTNYKVKITANNGLNIRTGASTSYKKIGTYTKNIIVNIIAESNGWGKTNKGWIYLKYTNNISSNSKKSSIKTTYKKGNYKVIDTVLNVRSGPGTNYDKKNYQQLTANARTQNKKMGNYYANGYQKGVICKVSQISGIWGKTPSGWICLNYCEKQ